MADFDSDDSIVDPTYEPNRNKRKVSDTDLDVNSSEDQPRKKKNPTIQKS